MPIDDTRYDGQPVSKQCVGAHATTEPLTSSSSTTSTPGSQSASLTVELPHIAYREKRGTCTIVPTVPRRRETEGALFVDIAWSSSLADVSMSAAHGTDSGVQATPSEHASKPTGHATSFVSLRRASVTWPLESSTRYTSSCTPGSASIDAHPSRPCVLKSAPHAVTLKERSPSSSLDALAPWSHRSPSFASSGHLAYATPAGTVGFRSPRSMSVGGGGSDVITETSAFFWSSSTDGPHDPAMSLQVPLAQSTFPSPGFFGHAGSTRTHRCSSGASLPDASFAVYRMTCTIPSSDGSEVSTSPLNTLGTSSTRVVASMSSYAYAPSSTKGKPCSVSTRSTSVPLTVRPYLPLPRNSILGGVVSRGGGSNCSGDAPPASASTQKPWTVHAPLGHAGSSAGSSQGFSIFTVRAASPTLPDASTHRYVIVYDPAFIVSTEPTRCQPLRMMRISEIGTMPSRLSRHVAPGSANGAGFR